MTRDPKDAARAYRPSDAVFARSLIRDSLGGTPYEPRILELLREADRGGPDCSCLVIGDAGRLDALALAGPVAGARNVWKIHAILFARGARAREVAGALLQATLVHAGEQDARMAVAELPADPPFGEMLSALRANDFDQVGRIADFYRDGVALLFLTRTLTRTNAVT